MSQEEQNKQGELQTFNFNIEDFTISNIRKEARRIIESKDKPESFSLAREYVELVEDRISNLEHEEKLKVFSQNLTNSGEEEVFVDRLLEVQEMSTTDDMYWDNFYDVFEYILSKLRSVLEEIDEARSFYRINFKHTEEEKEKVLPIEKDSSETTPRKYKLHWSFENQLQIISLFELLQEAGYVEEDTMRNLGGILKNTSLNNNKPINGDTISKKKKDPDYPDKRYDFMNKILTQLDNAYTNLSKDNGLQTYLSNNS